MLSVNMCKSPHFAVEYLGLFRSSYQYRIQVYMENWMNPVFDALWHMYLNMMMLQLSNFLMWQFLLYIDLIKFT